jgi:hypothetical protein
VIPHPPTAVLLSVLTGECDSGEAGAEAQEGARTLPRTDYGPDWDARTTDKRHRVGKHQQGDARSDGEGGRGYEADTWQAHAGEGRRNDVCHCGGRPRVYGEALADINIYRAKLQEQNALSEEIVEAMNSINIGNQVDEQDLEDELEALQQEELDQKMLETGTVPADAIQRMPAVANGERKLSYEHITWWITC